MVVETGIIFPPATKQPVLDAFVERIKTTPTDVTYLFASDPTLAREFGTPFVTAVDLSIKVNPLSTTDCTARPPAVVYAPQVGFLCGDGQRASDVCVMVVGLESLCWVAGGIAEVLGWVRPAGYHS